MCRDLLRSLALTLALSSLPAAAGADQFRLLPSLAVREEYNDNIFLAARNPQRSFISTLTPGLALQERTERVELSAEASAPLQRYHSAHNLDKADQRYRASLGVMATPRLKLTGDASYAVESRPDRFIDETGLAVPTVSERLTWSANGNYSLTPLTAVTASYSFDGIDYHGRTDTDYRSRAVTVAISRDLEQYLRMTRGRVVLSGDRVLFDGGNVATITGRLGVQKRIHELWTVDLEAGGRITRSRFDAGGGVDSATKETGWVGAATVAYQVEKTSGTLGFTRSVTAATGRNGASERTAATVALNRRLSYELSVFGSGGYYINSARRGSLATRTIDEETFRGSAGFRYEISRAFILETSYQYTAILDHQSHERRPQNMVWLRLVAKDTFDF